MRICFFTDDITKTGGIERVLSIIASNLAENTSHEIEIVSQFSGNEFPAYSFSNKIRFVTISTSHHGTKPHSLGRIVNLAKNIFAVRNYFNSRKDYYDLVLVQSFPNVVSIGLSGFDKKRIIAVEHVYAEYYQGILNKYRINLYSKLAKVVVLTSKDKEYFDSLLPIDKTIVIPNPAKIRCFSNIQKIPQRIVAAGRLVEQKGFDTLIEAYKSVHCQYPEWKLYIFGDGPLRNSLQSQIEGANLKDVISLCGNTDNLAYELSISQFFVLSSRFEGFPMVLVEAAAQGLPCVSFDCPNGPADIINNKNGILVKDQDIDSLITSIKYMIENPDQLKRMSIGAKQISQIYSETEICKKWEVLFEELK